MRGIAVLQARSGSTRLPAKALLPVAGMPLAVLAARRAGNTGRQVLVATSVETEDDALAAALVQDGISCHRGSLHNVLYRIVEALKGVDGDTIVIRLTADNVFPDGGLLDEVEEDFIERGVEYLACNGEPSGLPYGVSCEVTRVRHLRQAVHDAAVTEDREHVTPAIIRRFGTAWFTKYKLLGKGHFRCTVDSYDDYLTIQRVFEGIDDAVQAPLALLLERLDHAPWQPIVKKPARKLVMGTAQLGMQYGVTNRRGMPDTDESRLVLKTGIVNGAPWIDTARAYGSSECVVGTSLTGGWTHRVRVATKLSPLADIAPDAPADLVLGHVNASIFESAMRLRAQRLDALLLHRAQHLQMWGGAVWDRILELQRQGVIGLVGASVQDAKELELVLGRPDVQIVQMPFNLLDWRWDGLVQHVRARKLTHPLVVHARSSLLQGLLCTSDETLWSRAHVQDASAIVRWLEEQSALHACEGIAELCLSYVRSQDWIDGVVVGMESLDQALANVQAFDMPDLDAVALAQIVETRPTVEEHTLDPARWLTPETRQHVHA